MPYVEPYLDLITVVRLIVRFPFESRGQVWAAALLHQWFTAHLAVAGRIERRLRWVGWRRPR